MTDRARGPPRRRAEIPEPFQELDAQKAVQETETQNGKNGSRFPVNYVLRFVQTRKYQTQTQMFAARLRTYDRRICVPRKVLIERKARQMKRFLNLGDREFAIRTSKARAQRLHQTRFVFGASCVVFAIETQRYVTGKRQASQKAPALPKPRPAQRTRFQNEFAALGARLGRVTSSRLAAHCVSRTRRAVKCESRALFAIPLFTNSHYSPTERETRR